MEPLKTTRDGIKSNRDPRRDPADTIVIFYRYILKEYSWNQASDKKG